jgi:hypothetical protein
MNGEFVCEYADFRADLLLVVAPNNGTPWYKTCTAGAIGTGLLHVGIDAIGLIPEGGGIARVIGNEAGYRGIVATQYGIKAITQGKGALGVISGAFGLNDTSTMGRISTGLTIAGFIPGAGQIVSIASIGVDIVKTGMAVTQCP